MTDLAHLRDEMLVGRLPGWSPALTMRNGTNLREALDELTQLYGFAEAHGLETPQHVYAEFDDLAKERERLREILIAFGALDPYDTATGLLDLLEMLLPPKGGDA